MTGGIDTNIGLWVGRDVEIEFWVSARDPGRILLVIGESVMEISFDPAAVEALRDKADAAVRELRRVAARRSAAAPAGASGVVS